MSSFNFHFSPLSTPKHCNFTKWPEVQNKKMNKYFGVFPTQQILKAAWSYSENSSKMERTGFPFWAEVQFKIYI